MLIWLMAAAWSAEPIVIPMEVPVVPLQDMGHVPPPLRAGWRQLSVPGVDFLAVRLGETVIGPPGGAPATCTCDTVWTTCAMMDDGSLVFHVEDPTRPRKARQLGTCAFAGHSFALQASEPALPTPWERSPGRWVVPVLLEAPLPHAADLLFLSRSRRWAVSPGGACALVPTERRGGALVRWIGPGGAEGPVPCVHDRQGVALTVEVASFRFGWQAPPSSEPPPSAAAQVP